LAEVAIIGLGPWGLCALERLVDVARSCPASPVEVHVVEPQKPGGGLYSQPGPDYLILNTPCGQHNLYPYPERLGGQALGKGFYEWAVAQGYRWQGNECRISTGGRPLSPHDFLPRRLMGEYLEWFYECLVHEAPGNVSVVHHSSLAIDIEPVAGRRERVHLGGGDVIEVDHVVLTPGHTASAPAGDELSRIALPPYPVEPYLGRARPGEAVAVEGMGLVAIDVVTALTVGLGGTYEDLGGGKLRYVPSGREPVLYLFSRSGYPYCSKPFGAADPVGGHKPAICTSEAIARLRSAKDGAGGIDVRSELLPLVFGEMELVYYEVAAERRHGPAAARQVREHLVTAWRAGNFTAAKKAYSVLYGDFDAAEHIFIARGESYEGPADYQAKVYAAVEEDVREALVPGGKSPVKAALETLRALRDILRAAIEFKGLSPESWSDFQANLKSRLARPVTGPPVVRNQQLLALVDAGVVRLPFGPAPVVQATADGRVVVRSTALAKGFEMAFSHFVRGHMDVPSLDRHGSALLANLVRRGRLRPMELGGVPAGSVDLSSDFHPVGEDGPQPRLWVFGALTEGIRYFNLYIPSPKSRVRAFVDAEVCARSVLGLEEVSAGHRVPEAPLVLLPGRSHLKVAFVNNMADAAFEETESRWRQLVSAEDALQVELHCFSLPGVPRGPAVEQILAERYRPLDELWALVPDALVVTGAEPKKAELTDEAYWPSLEELLIWGRRTVPYMVASCLAAHAALWAFDRLPRRLLAEKCSGVFRQLLTPLHPLTAGVGELSLPHSRFNEVPSAGLTSAGYQLVSCNEDGAWTIAAAERDRCHLLLLQGHPEYTPQTLLREYRRDIRRYLQGAQGSYPHLPVGYLDPAGEELLEQYRMTAEGEPRDPERALAFPYGAALLHLRADWEEGARTLMANWARSVAGVTRGQTATA
jgi:homoserine O-succinyltransferase